MIVTLSCDLCRYLVRAISLPQCKGARTNHRKRCLLATPEERTERLASPSRHWPVSLNGIIRHESILLASRKYTERNPGRDTRPWRTHPPKRDAEKEPARRALRNAVAAGKIAKPTSCEECGKHAVLHGHHHDYDKPFDVRWLCVQCHGRAHRTPLLSIKETA